MKTNVALEWLKIEQRNLTKQQYRTLKGQILAGDIEGAVKGLRKVLGRVSAS